MTAMDTRLRARRAPFGFPAEGTRLVRIIRPGAHQRRKVFNFSDGVLGKQQLAKLADVDPTIRGLLEGSVVEIEPVDINVREDIRLQKCKSRPEAASRTRLTSSSLRFYRRSLTPNDFNIAFKS
jgi:hypothetical protein